MKSKLKSNRAITLVALVITIVIIIILSTIVINFTFGENGLITRAQQAAEMSEVSRILEQLEMAKGSAFIDGQGEIDPDHYFDIIEDEGIIGDKDTDVEDNGDGICFNVYCYNVQPGIIIDYSTGESEESVQK